MSGVPAVAALVGPTAVGKSEAGAALAERLHAEIVSVDSMQVYRGLDAGTAKPPPGLRTAVPHHLIDIVEPSHELSVAEFQSLARTAIADIWERGKLPLLVGGSGLYFRAAVDDLSFPPRSDEVRRQLETEAAAVGNSVMHQRLAALDPAAADRIESSNLRRVVRALEVIEITGRPFSGGYSWDGYSSVYRLAVAGLELDPARLRDLISGRVERMLARGLAAEARELASNNLSLTARQALGYRQVLEEPDAAPDELRDRIVAATARFARRQMTWFKADPRVVWFDASCEDLVVTLTGHFRSRLRLR
ncbi:MAG: tRNA (adenosine(37)-N6)-dimethylallyltransferase MiaA [Actinomycetota bacterium]|nr:tRNA (adenosine(37)-N6)-dimethylallyltransferase MiaA [Actinomycetota bacterium]